MSKGVEQRQKDEHAEPSHAVRYVFESLRSHFRLRGGVFFEFERHTLEGLLHLDTRLDRTAGRIELNHAAREPVLKIVFSVCRDREVEGLFGRSVLDAKNKIAAV